jgi:hypothetical protein
VSLAALGRVPYHVGIATTDLERAQQELHESSGYEWGPVATGAEGGLHDADGPVDWTARRCHNLGPGLHVELLEGSPGSIWTTDRLLEVHHLAYWSPDVPGEIEALVADGWSLEATLRGDDGVPKEFAYLARPGSARIELVAAHRRQVYLDTVEPAAPG